MLSAKEDDADSLTTTGTSPEARPGNIDREKDREDNSMDVYTEAIRFVLDNNQGASALAAFKILKTLIGNATDPGQDNRKRKISLSNPKIKQNIVEVEGALRIMKIAGFECRVESFQEWLIFEAERLQYHRVLLSELEKSIKALEEPSVKSQGKTCSAVVVQRNIDMKVDRYLFCKQWNDDSKDRNAIVTRNYKHAAHQRAKLQEKRDKGNKLSQTLRPYIHFALVVLGVVACYSSPGQTFNFALKVFVLYWISIIFVAKVGP